MVTYLGESTCRATAEKWTTVVGGEERPEYWENECGNVVRDENTGKVIQILPCEVEKETDDVDPET